MSYSDDEYSDAHGSASTSFNGLVRSQSQPTLSTMHQSTQPDYTYHLTARTLERWAFLVIEPKTYKHINYERIMAMIKHTGREMGFLVLEPLVVRYNVKLRDLKTVLMKCRANGVRFAVTVVPDRSCYFHKTKHLAECEVGVLTKCINERTILSYMKQRVMEFVLIKASLQLLGDDPIWANRILEVNPPEHRVMIVGADVNHSSFPETALAPSIATITASVDKTFTMYNVTQSMQKPWVEEILEFEDMMVEQLNVFVKHNGTLPTRILVYRHSIDEENYAEMVVSEIKALHRAYGRMPTRLKDAISKPELTYLFVESTLKERMVANNEDTSMIEAEKLLGYRVMAHQQIGNPYKMICRDGNGACLPHSQLKRLSRSLSYLCKHCTARLTYPLPAYYARLACKHARPLVDNDEFNLSELENAPQRLRVRNSILQYGEMCSE